MLSQKSQFVIKMVKIVFSKVCMSKSKSKNNWNNLLKIINKEKERKIVRSNILTLLCQIWS